MYFKLTSSQLLVHTDFRLSASNSLLIKQACSCSSSAAFHVGSSVAFLRLICTVSIMWKFIHQSSTCFSMQMKIAQTAKCVYITRSKNKVVLKIVQSNFCCASHWTFLQSTPVLMGYVEIKFCDKINYLSDIKKKWW